MFDYFIKDGNIIIDDYYLESCTKLHLNCSQYGVTEIQLIQYLKSLFQHIKCVRYAGELLGVEKNRLKVHDYSKMSIQELPYYTRRFFGDREYPLGFAQAWLHHIHSNDHHWQHWIFPDSFSLDNANIENGVLPMCTPSIKEMVADWMGSSFCYSSSWDLIDWLWLNIPKIRVHSATANELRSLLDSLGYADVIYLRKFYGE